MKDILASVLYGLAILLIFAFLRQTEGLKQSIDYYWPEQASCQHFDSEVQYQEVMKKFELHMKHHMDIGERVYKLEERER